VTDLITIDDFVAVLDHAVVSMGGATDRDWGAAAGTLEWSCWETVDHVIDCVFSYAVQVAAGAPDGWLPLELHPLPTATPTALVDALRTVGAVFAAVLRTAPADGVASNGVMSLDRAAWAARGAYEIAVHTHDVLRGLAISFEVSALICSRIVAQPGMWFIDRDRAATAVDPWSALLLGSGRGP
jgi:hypothetical protein